jgi:hypothetical protein
MQIKRLFAFGSLLVFAGGLAYAADQTILGNSLTVKDPIPGPTGVAKRKITGKGKEKGSSNTIVGNPTTLGGTLTVSAGGGTPSTQTYSLPQGTSMITGKQFWTGDAIKGFKYKNPKGEGSGAGVKVAQIKKTPSGNFSIKVVLSGKLGPVLVTPPNPGTNGCVLLGLNGGDTYSVAFKVGDGLVTNKGATLYKHKKVAMEGSCIVPVTTTTTTSTSSTSSSTSTTLYGSPSKAFFERVVGLLD